MAAALAAAGVGWRQRGGWLLRLRWLALVQVAALALQELMRARGGCNGVRRRRLVKRALAAGGVDQIGARRALARRVRRRGGWRR